MSKGSHPHSAGPDAGVFFSNRSTTQRDPRAREQTIRTTHLPLDLHQPAELPLDFRKDLQDITRHRRTKDLRRTHSRQTEIRQRGLDHDTTQLRDGLDEKDARHHRIPRKMCGKEVLISPDQIGCPSFVPGLKRDELIQKAE